MKITHYATATDDRPPQVVSAVDFTDNWPFDESIITVFPCRAIDENGMWHTEDDSYELDSNLDPVLAYLEDSQYAVTSPEGLAAYLTRTGQTPTSPPAALGTRAWVEANATPEPPTEPVKPSSTLAQAFAVAHTAPKFDPEAAARRTDLMPTSPADIQIQLNEEQRQQLTDALDDPDARCVRCTTGLTWEQVHRLGGEGSPHCEDCFDEVTQ